jgi:hypothetical protein
VVLCVFGGLLVTLYAAHTMRLPKMLFQAMLLIFPVAGFLAGVAAPFLLEYRGRLSVWSFFCEVLFMLIASVIVLVSIVLGVVLGAKAGSSVVTSDGTGLAVLFFLLSGAIIGIVPGVLFGSLVTTIWKFLRNGQRNLKPATSL